MAQSRARAQLPLLSQETLPCPCALAVTPHQSCDKERLRDEMFSGYGIRGMLATSKPGVKAACRAQHILWTRVQSREPPPSRGFQQFPEAAAAHEQQGSCTERQVAGTPGRRRLPRAQVCYSYVQKKSSQKYL